MAEVDPHKKKWHLRKVGSDKERRQKEGWVSQNEATKHRQIKRMDKKGTKKSTRSAQLKPINE